MAKTIAAGKFKQGCLALLDEVARTHRPLIITKRGKPVARLVPLEDERALEEQVLDGLRGRGRTLVSEAELLAPSSKDATWAATR